jgi:hypothetical protein
MFRFAAFAMALLLAASAGAQSDVEEILVTASRAEAPLPGTSLRRTGDYLLLRVEVTNDTREEDARKREIYDTLRGALASARKHGGIELSVVADESVIPLRVDSATVALVPGKRADTSTTTISVKTRIPAKRPDGQALISSLKDFVANIRPVGRTLLEPDGSVDISVVAPDQYRDEIVRRCADDTRKVTAALGGDHRVVLQGIDRPVEWTRVGLLELALYVPYSYVVLPSSVTSYLAVPAEF